VKLTVVAVGVRMPAWVDQAWDEYARRFPAELRLGLKPVKAAPRRGDKTPDMLKAAEARQVRAALATGVHVVALDERGDRVRTVDLARRLRQWQRQGQDVALLVGGPDGLDAGLLQDADERLRLSDLTLPHAMVRVLLAEQLYRAWSINAGHPYHRA